MSSRLREASATAGASHRARLLLALLLLALGARPLVADEIAVRVDDADHGCRVQGAFVVPVPPSEAWSVLSDYDHIPRFVHSMISSHAERRPDGTLLVHQVAVGSVFVFHRRMRVVLETHEEPERRIAFRDALKHDFESYAGEWVLTADSASTRVSYQLEAEPRGALAHALCRGALRHTAEELLEQVRDEMLRRRGARR